MILCQFRGWGVSRTKLRCAAVSACSSVVWMRSTHTFAIHICSHCKTWWSSRWVCTFHNCSDIAGYYSVYRTVSIAPASLGAGGRCAYRRHLRSDAVRALGNSHRWSAVPANGVGDLMGVRCGAAVVAARVATLFLPMSLRMLVVVVVVVLLPLRSC